ncbi:hypothetical protein ACG7TL_007553 [Trametes sanguinea]
MVSSHEPESVAGVADAGGDLSKPQAEVSAAPQTKPAGKAKAKSTGQKRGAKAASDHPAVPAGTAEATAKAVPKERVNVPVVLEGGFIGSEDEGEEALAAKSSPVKGGARSTSSALVQCEDVDLATPGKPKKRGSAKGSSSGVSGASTSSTKTTNTSLSVASKASLGGGSQEGAIEFEDKGDNDNNNDGDNDGDNDDDDDDDDDNDDARSAVTNTTAKSRSAPKNADLPAGAHDRSKWRLQFIPTVLRILGAHEDPWNLSDKVMVKLLQKVWDSVYGEAIPHRVRVNDAVHALSTQRVYEWRSAFGHAALRAFESFFESRSKLFPDPDACRQFCAKILDNCRLFYKNPEEEARRGLYRSPFIISAMATHMSAIHGAVQDASLYGSIEEQYPYGAIGLAAAAVYRVATLWQAWKINYGKTGRAVIIKTVNIYSGKLSSKDTDFSSANFSTTTSDCARSARNLPAASLDRIVEAASIAAQLPSARAKPRNGPSLPNFGALSEEAAGHGVAVAFAIRCKPAILSHPPVPFLKLNRSPLANNVQNPRVKCLYLKLPVEQQAAGASLSSISDLDMVPQNVAFVSLAIWLLAVLPS